MEALEADTAANGDRAEGTGSSSRLTTWWHPAKEILHDPHRHHRHRRIAGWHAQSYRDIPGVKVVACCDIVKERAEAFAQKHAIPAVYTDYPAMLRRRRWTASQRHA